MFSASPLRADIPQRSRHLRFVARFGPRAMPNFSSAYRGGHPWTPLKLSVRALEACPLRARFCPSGQISCVRIVACLAPFTKNSVFQNTQLSYISAVPSHRGALRNVINAGRDAWTLIALTTKAREADGEIVWSLLRDAGVKSAIRSAGDGGKRARSPGRARISRKPSRREGRTSSVKL